MDKALLQGDDRRTWGTTVFVKELKKVSYMAAPMVAVSVSQYLLQVISLMIVGHIGELALSGVAIATSFTNVTGFSLLFGMAGALETLGGQAYGAEQYQKLGTYTYCSILSLITICFPVSLFWIFMDEFLIFMGQDPQISHVASIYSIWLIPALFADAILQSLVRYFQSQSQILPLFLSSCATICFHVPLCWVLVHKTNLGYVGAALAITLALWFNVIVLGFYMRWSASCESTRTVIVGDVFASIKEFLSFALPSAVMCCLEWWSFELLVLLSGLLPDSELETSVLSICLSTTSLHYFVPYGVGAAASLIAYALRLTCATMPLLLFCSTRVSNELGAGNPHSARVAVNVVMILGIFEAMIVSITLFSCRYAFGYLYSNEQEVIDYVGEMIPLISLSVVVDSLLAVISGVARGTGWQHIGAYVNLGAYYLVGIPVAALLCFSLHLRGKGLWIGILTGSSLQLASKAQERIFEEKFSNGLLA
ncbi:protein DETOXIFICATION 8-like [Gossypium australe]|uniref:Protein DETOXIFICATION n=1 Tax=Gossypium australe TaxID=47621 RepID=A0A5B6UJS9_9ROSI|nr:protein DETOXIFICATION 8-like [Gossypium australe]